VQEEGGNSEFLNTPSCVLKMLGKGFVSPQNMVDFAILLSTSVLNQT
jgi:hypothetical protein